MVAVNQGNVGSDAKCGGRSHLGHTSRPAEIGFASPPVEFLKLMILSIESPGVHCEYSVRSNILPT